MESKLALVQQLPPPAQNPTPSPLLLEVQQLRQEIEDLRVALRQDQESRQEIAELKTMLRNLANLIRFSTGPRLPEIRDTVRAELAITPKALLAEIQRIVHVELEAALRLSKTRLDALPEKIVQVLPHQKKGLFG